MSITVVQRGTDHNNGTNQLTFGFASPLTAGNAVIACIGSVVSPVSSVLLSDSTSLSQRLSILDDFNQVNLTVYDVFNVAGGETTLTVNLGLGNANEQINLQVYEVSGLSGTVDTSTTNSGSGTSFTSGSASTGYSTDFWLGVGQGFSNSTFTLTGPASAWTNFSVINNSAGGFFTRLLSGYQIVSATGSMAYTGTLSPSTNYDAAAVAYEGAATVVSGSGSSVLKLTSTGTGSIRGFATGSSTLLLTTQCTPIVEQKLIISVASQSGTRPSGAEYPAGMGLFGIGGIFGYAGVLEASGLSLSLAMNAGQDQAGNEWPAGLMAVGVYLTPTSQPATPSSGCVLYYSGGSLYALGPSGTPVKLATT